MQDRNIPFYNTLMRADVFDGEAVRDALDGLPEGILLRGYRLGDEDGWAALHVETGDFGDFGEAKTYFLNTYTADVDRLSERSVFAEELSTGRIVGVCIAWRDPAKKGIRREIPTATVASLHWLAAAEDFRRRGIGAALCAKVLTVFHEAGEFPVYLHTQPWSYPAVMLYTKFGFGISRNDTFASYENQFEDAYRTLSEVLSAEEMRTLAEHIID